MAKLSLSRSEDRRARSEARPLEKLFCGAGQEKGTSPRGKRPLLVPFPSCARQSAGEPENSRLGFGRL